MTLFHAIQGAGGVKPAATTVVDAQIPFAYAGTYSVKVPSGVTSMCMLCVGAAGSGGGTETTGGTARGGGGGGALSYSNAVAVTPGETLTVVVGQGGAGPASGSDGNPGGDSSVSNSGGTLVLAKGGGGGTSTAAGAGGVAASGTGDTKQTGGAGGDNSADVGSGGGGAAGYSGTGGKGGFGTTAATAGAGGGGGGGGFGTATSLGGCGGGGVGLFGEGSNGGAGTGGASRTGGGGGSGGTAGFVSNSDAGAPNSNTGYAVASAWGSYLPSGGCGGGGGSANDDGATGGAGAVGGVSLIWGSGRSFPSTDVAQKGMFIRGAAESSTATIIIPAATQVGDLILFVDRPQNSTGLPTEVVPGDFTNLSKLNGPTTTTTRQYINYKVAVSGDAGATVTGMDGNNVDRKGIIVLGTTIASPTWTFSAVNAEITDGDPAAQTVNTSTLTKYNAAIAFMGSSAAITPVPLFSPFPSNLIGFTATNLLGCVTLNGFESFTINQPDNGTNNACQSFYVTVE